METVANFQIRFHRFIGEDGKPCTDKLPGFARQYDELSKLYRLMSLTRVFDTKAVALQRTGKLGTYASSLGHEAIHVGIGSAMAAEDIFCPMYREYGAQFCRGVKMSEVLAYWGGDERGNDFSGPEHDFAWCVPIATQCMHAAGAALAMKLSKQPRCAVSVVGDGGSSKGDFLEALNAAGVWKLPAVFVIANNQWAISVPRDKQSGARTLAQKGIGAGVPGLQVDGNDLVAMRWAMDAALERARSGKGATLIEAITYRLGDHTTADDATRYRDAEQVDAAWKREPLIRLRAYLTDQGHWSDAQQDEMETAQAKAVAEAVDTYMNTPPQPPESMFDYLHAELPDDFAAQRQQAIELGS